MPEKDEIAVIRNNSPIIPRSRRRKIIYTACGVLLLLAIAGGILVTSYPNTIIHYVVEPKLKQLIVDRLGRRYSLQMNSITLSPNKDSLILTGVRIVDNGKADDGSSDTASPGFGVATPLDRFSTDTVVIAALDYWKLILQKGLFAGTINIRSPIIYLRPGTLPKFADNTALLPSFLPAVSSKIIKIENAKVYFSDGEPTSQAALHNGAKSALPRSAGGLLVKSASLEFRDFYLDEPTFKKTISTFFCKSATFHAEDISHVDSLGVTDLNVATVDGDLIDSSLNVFTVIAKKPIEEIRRTAIKHIELTGLDWYAALAGHGLHAKSAIITTPQIYLLDIADIRPYPSSAKHISASDLIPLPSLLPNVKLGLIKIADAEVYALLPESRSVSSLKRITMSLRQFKVDSSTPFANISTFFSRYVNYGIKGESIINTYLGALKFSQVDGTEKSVTVSNITLAPSVKGLKLVRMKSAEISGVDIWKLLMRQGLVSSSLTLREPEVFLDKSATSPLTSFDSVLLYDPLETIRHFKQYPLPLIFPVVNIGSITVSNGVVRGIHFLDNPENTLGPGDSITHLDLSLKIFRLDHDSWTRRRGMLFSDAGTFSIGAMRQHTQGAIYSYYEGGIKGDLRKRTITIDSVLVHPLISEDSFGAAFKYRTERFDLIAPKILIAGIDYQRLLLGNGFFADSILAPNWRMHVYGDRRKPEEVRTIKQKYPHEIFQQIRMPIGIKSTSARNGIISFRESWPDTTEPGTIIMTHVNAHIGEISNDTINGGATKATPIEGDMMIMGEGLVTFNMTYQLMNPTMAMNIHGHAGSMDASLLNHYLALTEPFTLTGNVRSADFNIDIKGDQMTGTLIPQYDSLHVKFFRWDKFPPGLVSFLANALFMRGHNTPELDHPLHTAEISDEIDRSASLLWAIWLPVRNAIGSIVRIPEWVW